VTERRADELAAVADLLVDGLPRRKMVRAALGHALDFQTWCSLARLQGLTRRQAVDAMVRFSSAARSRWRKSSPPAAHPLAVKMTDTG
jgi:hypothetical protein